MADLVPKVGAREPTKTEQAAEVIRGELTGGDWHLSAPIILRLKGRGPR